METEEVLTVQEVARLLKVTTKTVYALIHEDRLQHFRIGRAVRCRRSDVESFILNAISGSATNHERGSP